MIIKREIKCYQCDFEGCKFESQYYSDFRNFDDKIYCDDCLKIVGKNQKCSHNFIQNDLQLEQVSGGVYFTKKCRNYTCYYEKKRYLTEWELTKLVGLGDD